MPKQIGADLALHYLVAAGDVLEVDGRRFLVAPVSDELVEMIAVALAATEDNEEDDPGGDVCDRGEFDPCDLGEPEEYLDG